MRSASLVAGLFVCLTGLVLVTQQRTAGADELSRAQVTAAQQVTQAAELFNPAPEAQAKKCSFNSDCPYGKCSKGKCGGCSFNSDCKGWGKCKKGQCGGCSFASDCKGFGKCSSGRCSKSPY